MPLKNSIDFEDWIDKGPNDLYFNYWNDPSKQDVYNISGPDFKELEKFLDKMGLYQDISNIIKYLKAKKVELVGQGLDVAAGNLWTTAYLLNKIPSIKHMICLEYSKHRVLDVGLKLLDYYNVDKKKIKIVHGDFYDIKLSSNSIDFAILCGTLHHASNPSLLLEQISRVLKKGGLAVVIGDPFIKKSKYFFCMFKYIVLYSFAKILSKSHKEFFLGKIKISNYNLPFRQLYFPVDQVTGDHYHLRKEYHNLFKKDFIFKEFKSVRGERLSFLLIKK